MVCHWEIDAPRTWSVQAHPMVPTPRDVFAEAVALVGDEGFLWGESVLSMHALALVDPRAVTVATPKRIRRKLPAWVKTVPAPENAKTTFYEGIPSQCVADAIEACKGSVMTERSSRQPSTLKPRALLPPMSMRD